ncbi:MULTISPECIES: IclR family transcriptional regulator [Micromonospora]|uniref:IclR family transcriptional regulator n=1 Tax=Micromonospora TaxID=1873 RepID=UPI001EF0883E|nr:MULTISPECIES: helix-turn-helix domain-containing protein [unclassified Micromonospora]
MSRALRVLEAVGGTPRGLTVKQVASRCGLNSATVYHIVRTLTYEGYLVRREDGTFTAGLQVAHRYRDLREAIRPSAAVTDELRRLAVDTGYTHCLAQFVDGRITLTAVAPGPRTAHHDQLVPGFHEAPHVTAWGLALLSTLTPTRASYLKQAPTSNLGTSTVSDVEALNPTLTTANRGRLHSESGHYHPATATAAVLVSTAGQPAALACVLSTADLQRTEHTVRKRLVTAATRITKTPPT